MLAFAPKFVIVVEVVEQVVDAMAAVWTAEAAIAAAEKLAHLLATMWNSEVLLVKLPLVESPLVSPLCCPILLHR